MMRNFYYLTTRFKYQLGTGQVTLKGQATLMGQAQRTTFRAGNCLQLGANKLNCFVAWVFSPNSSHFEICLTNAHTAVTTNQAHSRTHAHALCAWGNCIIGKMFLANV